MIHHFDCPATPSWINDPLVFDWDDETGEITGPGAERVLECFKDGHVPAHPIPWNWDLTSPKSKTDLAAIIGYSHELPDVLKDHYPQLEEDEWPDETYVDEDGVVVIGKNSMVF
jgi:hypothetical protein